MRIIYISLIVLISITACTNNKENNQGTSTEIRQQSIDELLSNPKITLGNPVSKKYREKVHCTGTVGIPPTDLLAVHSQVAGSIAYMKYLPGDYVKKGALLFRISNPKLIEWQRNFLETMEKQKLSEKEFERKNGLYQSGAINDKEFQIAESEKNLLTLSLKGLKTELENMGINTEKLENEQEFQNSVPVYSQISGYIQEVFINKGEWVQADTRLMSVANDQHIHLELNVLSKDVPYVKKGQRVSFFLPNHSQELEAEVVKLNPLLNEKTGTRSIHCHLEENDCESILPGMFVNADIDVDEQELIGLPLDAVIKEGQDYFAFRKNGDNLIKTELERVRLAEDFVICDLAVQDTFVLSGAYYLE